MTLDQIKTISLLAITSTGLRLYLSLQRPRPTKSFNNNNININNNNNINNIECLYLNYTKSIGGLMSGE